MTGLSPGGVSLHMCTGSIKVKSSAVATTSRTDESFHHHRPHLFKEDPNLCALMVKRIGRSVSGHLPLPHDPRAETQCARR